MHYLTLLNNRLSADTCDDELAAAKRAVADQDLPRGDSYTVRVCEAPSVRMPVAAQRLLAEGRGRDVVVEVPPAGQGRMSARWAT